MRDSEVQMNQHWRYPSHCHASEGYYFQGKAGWLHVFVLLHIYIYIYIYIYVCPTVHLDSQVLVDGPFPEASNSVSSSEIATFLFLMGRWLKLTGLWPPGCCTLNTHRELRATVCIRYINLHLMVSDFTSFFMHQNWIDF